MFGFKRRKKIQEADKHLKTMIEQLEKLKDQSMLIGIERKGRKNVFSFVRNQKIHQIETMGLINDDLANWKKLLLE